MEESDGSDRMVWARILFIVLVETLLSTSTHAEVLLAAHRAVYDLSLLKSSGLKAPTQAHGRIVLEFTGSACEGYVQNFRQITDLQPAEGDSRLSQMTSATFEGPNSESFRFKSQTRIGPTVVANVDGSARKRQDGVEISFEKSKKPPVNIAAPTLFPTEHLRRILAAARAGDKFLEARVFDGSADGDKPYETLTMIGAPVKDPAPEKAAQEQSLKETMRWPVSASYFETNKPDGEPLYVLSFDLYENGVSRALRLDYGDFAMSGELVALTFLKTTPCGKVGEP